MTPDGRMGMSNMWSLGRAGSSGAGSRRHLGHCSWRWKIFVSRDHHGQWFGSGFDKDPLGDSEGIRDWNLRAVFGAFNAMKNRDGAADHRKAFLTWVAYIGG